MRAGTIPSAAFLFSRHTVGDHMYRISDITQNSLTFGVGVEYTGFVGKNILRTRALVFDFRLLATRVRVHRIGDLSQV